MARGRTSQGPAASSSTQSPRPAACVSSRLFCRWRWFLQPRAVGVSPRRARQSCAAFFSSPGARAPGSPCNRQNQRVLLHLASPGLQSGESRKNAFGCFPPPTEVGGSPISRIGVFCGSGAEAPAQGAGRMAQADTVSPPANPNFPILGDFFHRLLRQALPAQRPPGPAPYSGPGVPLPPGQKRDEKMLDISNFFFTL